MFAITDLITVRPTTRLLSPCATTKIAHRVAARFAKAKTSAVVLRDVPVPGWAWGWYASDIEPRMVIRPMNAEHRGLGWIFLEDREGQRTFEAVGAIPARVLASLRPLVEANRHRIEAAWVRTMIISGWVDARLVQCTGAIQIVSYRGLSNQRLNLVTVDWPRIVGPRAPEPEDVALDADASALVVGARELRPVRVPLAGILWREVAPMAEREQRATREATIRLDRTNNHGVRDLLARVCRRLPSDYEPYGRRVREDAADCSCGCRWYLRLPGELSADWGVCCNPASPRAGLVTLEHQGCGEFEQGVTAVD
jgi:hypothetical protein